LEFELVTAESLVTRTPEFTRLFQDFLSTMEELVACAQRLGKPTRF
jgi:hypothetical protein